MKKTVFAVLIVFAVLLSYSGLASAFQAVKIRSVGLYSCDGVKLVSVYASERAFETALANFRNSCYVKEEGSYDSDCLLALQSLKSSAKRLDYSLEGGSKGAVFISAKSVAKGSVVYLDSLRLENIGSEPITSLNLKFVLKSDDESREFNVVLSNEDLSEYLSKEPSLAPSEEAKEPEVARTKIVCIDGTQKPLSKGNYFELSFTEKNKKTTKYYDSSGRMVSEYRGDALESGVDFKRLCKKLGGWSAGASKQRKAAPMQPVTSEETILAAWEPGEVIEFPVFSDFAGREKSHVVAVDGVELSVSGSVAMIVPGTISVPLEQFPPSMIKRESSQPQGETLSATNLRLLPSNRIALNNGWSLLYKDFYSLETEGAGGDGAPETRFVNVFQVFDEKDKLASEIKREDALRADEKARIKKFSRKIERSGKKFFFEIPESYKVDSCGAVDASLFSFKPRVYRGFGDQNLFLGDSVKLATSEGVWTIKVVDLASDGVALEARLNNENTPRLSKRLVKESGGRGGEQQQEVGFETGNEITGVFQGTDLVRGLTSASMLRYATITLNPKKSAQSEEGAEENANGKANGEVKPLGGNQ